MYKLLPNTTLGNASFVKRLADNAFIPMSPDNTDYLEYLVWLSEGNTPEPADIPPAPTYQELRRAEYPPIGDQLDAMWKGGVDETAMLATIMAVKAKHPKP